MKIHLSDLSDWTLTGSGLEKHNDRAVQLAGAEARANVDLVPFLSDASWADAFSAGTISEDSIIGAGNLGWQCFRFDPAPRTTDGWIGNVNDVGWLRAAFDYGGVVVNRVTIRAFNSANFGRSPIDFTIRGSTDGFVASDVVLDTIVAEPNWSQDEERTYDFTNIDRYTHYEIRISKIQVPGNAPGIGLCNFKNLFSTSSPVAESPVITVTGTLDATTPIVIDDAVSGTGNVRFQYKTNGGAYNGSWVTEAAMNTALASQAITSFQIKIQFNAANTDRVQVFISPTYTEITIPSVDHAAIADVRLGTVYDSGNLTGTLAVPAKNKVVTGVATDDGVGTYDPADEADVLLGELYGEDGTGRTGTLLRYAVETNASDTIRQQIMDVQATRWATILISNGYKTNAGQNVFEWKGFGVADTQMPGIFYKDIGVRKNNDTIGQVENRLRVALIVMAKGNPATVEPLLREMIADIIQAIGTDVDWSGLAQDTDIVDEPTEMEQLENKVMAALLEIEILYTTDRHTVYAT